MPSRQVVFITYSFGFPNGMASTQRARLLAKGLVENGIQTLFLCVTPLERHPIENAEATGYYEGVCFEYTPGTTVRSDSFTRRRWLELRGLIVAIHRLMTLKANDEIYCIYLYGNEKLTVMGCTYRAIAALLGIPLLLELNEAPWSLRRKSSWLERKLSPIAGATGVIVISDFLFNWVQTEAKRISKKVRMLYIPILIDPKEAGNDRSELSQDVPKILFAGAPVYAEAIRFIIKSMGIVVDQYPKCKLIITGCKDTDLRGAWVQTEKIESALKENIVFAGYVPRKDLLTLYRNSNALLIPLFDDVTSKARFPTKVGEYLLSGRPVITTDIGDVTKYLTRNWSAFICKAGDPMAFAELIFAALNHPDQANEIGQRGKEVALQSFDYSNWAKRLSEFIRSLR